MSCGQMEEKGKKENKLPHFFSFSLSNLPQAHLLVVPNQKPEVEGSPGDVFCGGPHPGHRAKREGWKVQQRCQEISRPLTYSSSRTTALRFIYTLSSEAVDSVSYQIPQLSAS